MTDHPSRAVAKPLPKETLLSARGLVAGYNGRAVLHDVGLEVRAGDVVAVLGPNGSGKSTLLRALVGIVPLQGGEVFFAGSPARPLSPRSALQAGVAFVPQGGQVFADLTVRENLEVAGSTISSRETLRHAEQAVLDLFPELSPFLSRRAGPLSGGEKQLLCLAMGLLTRPRLLLLDEPSLGLAPALFRAVLGRLRKVFQERGTSCLLVEHRVREVLDVATEVVVLVNGAVAHAGPAAALEERQLIDLFFARGPR